MVVLGVEVGDEDPLAGGETGGVEGGHLVHTLQLGGPAEGNLNYYLYGKNNLYSTIGVHSGVGSWKLLV